MKHHVHCAADGDHILVPYFRTADTCPICLTIYDVGSVDGVAIQTCACGSAPVPRRFGADVVPQQNMINRAALAEIHKAVRATPGDIRPCLVCGTMFSINHEGRTKLCSSECAAARRKTQAIRKPPRTCTECSAFIRRSVRRTTCSDDCLKASRRRKELERTRAHFLAKVIL